VLSLTITVLAWIRSQNGAKRM